MSKLVLNCFRRYIVDSSAAASQSIARTMDAQNFVKIKEGKAEILYKTSKDVFYNPVQEFNRDLSVSVLNLFSFNFSKKVQEKKNKSEKGTEQIAQNDGTEEHPASINLPDAIEGDSQQSEVVVQVKAERKVLEPGKVYDEGLKVLEALAASGLRSVRYAKEVGGIRSIVANDLSRSAVENMKMNIDHNQVANLVTPSENDATVVMYQHRKLDRFDAIDLDPYGSPTPFLDAAVQSVSEGGLLLITATDMGVLCGSAQETCYYKYGAVPFKTKSCHEMALRIMLQHVQAHATRYGRFIRPLLSVSVDFYMRIFVQVFTGNRECKRTASETAMAYMCTGCETMNLQYLNRCTVVGNNDKFARTTGPLSDQNVNTAEALITSAILNAGYRVSYSHCAQNSIKTDAPPEFLWDVFREFAKGSPERKLNEIASRILSQPITHKVDFTEHKLANPESRMKKLVRFQENPEKNWGPKHRARINLQLNEEEKRIRNQGKKKRKVMKNDTVVAVNADDGQELQ